MLDALKDIHDWEAYQAKLTTQAGVAGTMVQWGNGPQEYPCLVGTYMPPLEPNKPPKFVSCYVYRQDAEALLKLFGKVLEAEEKPRHPGQATQSDFNRWVTAYLLTLTWFNRETGISKPEAFEEKLRESLELTDEVKTARRNKIIAALDPQDQIIVDRLLPPE